MPPCRSRRDDAPEAAVAAAERLTSLFSTVAALRAAAERAPATLELAARTAAAEAELAAFKEDASRELAEWDARFGTQTAEAPREALVSQLLKLPTEFGAALTAPSSAAAGASAALARLSTPELRLLAQASLAGARRVGADAVAALRAAEAAALSSRAQQLQLSGTERVLPKPAVPPPAAASAAAPQAPPSRVKSGEASPTPALGAAAWLKQVISYFAALLATLQRAWRSFVADVERRKAERKAQAEEERRIRAASAALLRMNLLRAAGALLVAGLMAAFVGRA